MKTIVRKGTEVSLYLINDDVPVFVGDGATQIGDPATLIVTDCTSSDVVLHENVTAPDDWAGCKYLFDGNTWTPNPDWVDPAI